jgi:hypothetical protein
LLFKHFCNDEKSFFRRDNVEIFCLTDGRSEVTAQQLPEKGSLYRELLNHQVRRIITLSLLASLTTTVELVKELCVDTCYLFEKSLSKVLVFYGRYLT